jgi:DNA-binding XRE family transcriptional regulator
MSLCPNCQIRTKQKHFNSRWCKPCADSFKKRPRPNLSTAQKKEALRLRGKLTKEEIAKRIGASRSSVMRLGRDLKLSFAATYKYKANPRLVKQVCQYYEKHGKVKTQEKFPQVSVRSIVERYKCFSPRQTRWTDDQLMELARMAGIVSQRAQAKYFKRPGANEGSIKSAWMKKFKSSGGSINGLSWNIARHFVTKQCKPMRTQFWTPRNKRSSNLKGRQVVLWTEMQKHLKADVPQWIKESVQAMAKFQIWLHGSAQVKRKIIKLIEVRE